MVLTPEQQRVFDALELFEIGLTDIDLTFTKRLARENGWNRSFSERSVREYKRFLFLAKFAGHPVTPSDEVDQVWHLHMVYTNSYWNELCANVLQLPLHHGPTKGGSQEGEKFVDWYQRTKESYTKFFGAPPEDLWPSSDVRFRYAASFRRINCSRHWVIPKQASYVVGILVAVLAPLFGCVGNSEIQNPLTDFSANQFLIMYSALVMLCGAWRIYDEWPSGSLRAGGGLVLALGVTRVFIGLNRNRPVGYLVGLVLIQACILFVSFSGKGGDASGSGGCGSAGCGGGGCGGGGCGGCGS